VQNPNFFPALYFTLTGLGQQDGNKGG